MRSSFSPTDPIAEQLRELAGVELRAALRVAGDPVPTAGKRIHDARLRMKRLRALLRLARTGFAAYATENRAARDASAGLSEMRDAAVLRDTLAALVREIGERKDRCESFGAALVERIPGEETQRVALADFATAVAPILERSMHLRLDRADHGLIVDNAVATYRRGRKAFHLAERAPSAADFHEWRKQVKYQLYQLDYLGGARLKLATTPVLLRRLSDLLGLYCDRQVLRLALAEHSDRKKLAWLEAAAAQSQEKLAAKALKLGAQLYRRKPSQWRAQLESASLPPGESA